MIENAWERKVSVIFKIFIFELIEGSKYVLDDFEDFLFGEEFSCIESGSDKHFHGGLCGLNVHERLWAVKDGWYKGRLFDPLNVLGFELVNLWIEVDWIIVFYHWNCERRLLTHFNYQLF